MVREDNTWKTGWYEGGIGWAGNDRRRGNGSARLTEKSAREGEG